jgi:hypothetical protein
MEQMDKEIEQAAANLANPNACKTANWIEGAKYMAERMYSEEELKLAYNEGQVSIINSTCVRTEEWFEQFKKK